MDAALRPEVRASRCEADLVLVIRTFAQNKGILTARVDGEVGGRSMLALKPMAPFLSAVSRTTITSSGKEAKTSRV